MPPKGTWRTYNEGIKNSNEEMRFAKIGQEECYFFSYHSFSTKKAFFFSPRSEKRPLRL